MLYNALACFFIGVSSFPSEAKIRRSQTAATGRSHLWLKTISSDYSGSAVEIAADGFEELAGGEGLLDEIFAGLQVEVASAQVPAVTAGKKNFERRFVFSKPLGEFKSAKSAGHDQVRKEKRYFAGMR